MALFQLLWGLESAVRHRKKNEIGTQGEADLEGRENILAGIEDPVPVSPKEQAMCCY